MFTLRFFIPTLGMLLGVTPIAHANLIFNGSFEMASIDPGAGVIKVGPGQTSIPGWDILAEDVRYIGTYWKASDGGRSISIDGRPLTAGSRSYGAIISHPFPIVSGTSYEVSFDIAQDPTNQNSVYYAAPMVTVGGQSKIFYASSNPGSDILWQRETLSFVAYGSSDTIKFETLRHYNGWEIAIDNVVVTAVPEPAAYAMMLAGLGLIGFRVWRQHGA